MSKVYPVISPDSDKTGIHRYVIDNLTEQKAADLRQAILLHVPGIAANTFVFHQNTSLAYPEIIAERISRIPLVVKDINQYNEESDIRLFLSCTYADVAKDVVQVPGTDITLGVIKSKWILSTDPNVQVIDGDIPICYLQPFQQLMVEIHANYGTGKDAMKYRPISLVNFNPLPTVMVNPGTITKAEQKSFLFEITSMGTVPPDDCMNMAIEAWNSGKVKKFPPLRKL